MIYLVKSLANFKHFEYPLIKRIYTIYIHESTSCITTLIHRIFINELKANAL